MRKFVYTLLILAFTLELSGCSGNLFTVHKIDVQQGNAVDFENVEMLKVGMTRDQVKFLLGTPLVADIFHPDRWDYIYYLIPGYGEIERRHLTIYFNGDNVSEIIKNQIEAPPAEQAESAPEENVETEPEKS